MTTKKQMLVKNFANILLKYSADDLRYAAQHFEEIARLAAQMASDAEKVRPARKRLSAAAKRKIKPANLEPKQYSKNTTSLVHHIEDLPIKPSVALARTIAVSVGMKNDIPKTKQKILEKVYDHLETLGLEARERKIEIVKSILERSANEQADAYERWVSVITKRPSS